ncbi:2'-5' RNA ligase family protein [Hymenobacter weizhouensis]|uniref:2'-5' RNA ligase family protein n=1 Tax=Hymenobacter sp. YIM 151500-1 TaxID=2987689 RepID=UPI0022279446|nr:hypothetical protein [Hymenobacter sp. YIM 151500-1]UYZ62089.1 hypothetical protein OIS53_13870 [Hymenobacter sp. YIM 151500-1]
MPDPTLRAHYDAIFAQGAQALRTGEAAGDKLLLHPAQDTRLGLTVLLPLPHLAAALQAVQAEIQATEPALYQYPPTDLHVTVISLLTARPNRRFSPAQWQAYAAVVAAAATETAAFTILFEGLTLSAQAVVAQGYPTPALQQLRETIRALAVAQGLPLDERYHSQTAHATFVRFPQLPRHPQALVQFVEAHRDLPLGTETVTEILLVAHDWYNRQARSQVLARFQLK